MRFIVFICLFFVGLNAVSQSRVWITAPTTPDSLVSGEHITLVFTVHVENEHLDSLKGKMTLPEGWSVLSERKINRGDGKAANFFYTIKIPGKTNAGFYKLRFDVSTQGRIRGIKRLEPRLLEVRKIEILSVYKPEFLRDGDIMTTEFRVQNLGNVIETIILSTDRGKIEGETEDIKLEPGDSYKVTLTQKLPKSEVPAWSASSRLKVHTPCRKDPYTQVVSLPVYSRKPQKLDKCHRFPINIGATYLNYVLSGEQVSTYQYLITGKGSLDAPNNHKMNFTVRGPNRMDFPVMSSYDQYSLEYAYKDKLQVLAGDYYLRFNNLMELGRFGRGLYADYKPGKVGFRAFYQEPRFYPGQKDSYGLETNFTWKKDHELGLAYLSKNSEFRREMTQTDMAGLTLNIRNAGFNIESEVAASKVNELLDWGAFNRISFSVKKFNFNNNLIYTGKDFNGFYTNSRLSSTGMSYAFSRKINVGANHYYSRINPGLDLLIYNTSPFTHTLMVYGNYALNSANGFNLYYSTGKREDKQTPSSYHYGESYFNLGYRLSTRYFRLMTSGRYGKTQNYLVETDSYMPPKRTYISDQIYPELQIFKGVWLGGIFDHQYTSRFSTQDISQHLFYYGGSLQMNRGNAFSARVMYRNSYAPDELYEARNYLDAAINLNLKRHKLSFTAGRMYLPNPEYRNQNTLYFNLTYQIGLGMPLAKRKNLGKLTGRVVNAAPGIPLNGYLLRLGGLEVITDATGRFTFDNMTADRYLLSMQKGLDRAGIISTIKLPKDIVIKKDSVSYLEIPLVRTGGISGQVVLEKPESSKAEMPAVMLKLYNENTGMITDLKAGGEYSFKEVIPGNWKIKAYFPGENKDFILDNEEKDIRIGKDAWNWLIL